MYLYICTCKTLELTLKNKVVIISIIKHMDVACILICGRIHTFKILLLLPDCCFHGFHPVVSFIRVSTVQQ